MNRESSGFSDKVYRKKKGMMLIENLDQLFVRHGWKLEEAEENVFNLHCQTEDNLTFLRNV